MSIPIQLTQLESIQRGMTRFVTKFDGRSYQDMCIDLNLLPLCFRHEIIDLALFYKCLNKDTKIHIENFIQTFMSILREDLVTAAYF